jgi:multidrug efflux pump subunit AcrB
VLALTGMIVRNSVILIDQVEKETARGRHPWDAVVAAATRRFRPILLPCAETACMLFRALLASGQITLRRVDGPDIFHVPPTKLCLDRAA